MEFLFGVAELSVPLIQEIVFLSVLEYDILDCLKPPHYFIPKNSIPIENHTGYNLAQHAKLKNPSWIGVPPETSTEKIQELIQQTIDPKQSIVLERSWDCILYSFQSDNVHFTNFCKKHDLLHFGTKWGQYCDFDFNKRMIKLHIISLDGIKHLDATPYHWLTILNCSDNQSLTKLTLGNCPHLEELLCYKTNISTIDLSGCPNLKTLSCGATNISNLSLVNCTKLQELYCSTTNITTLDVHTCSQLKNILCCYSPIKTVDVTNCSKLQELRCFETLIEELDLSLCPKFKSLVSLDSKLTKVLCVYKYQINCTPLELKSVLCNFVSK